MDLGLSALGRGHATLSRPVARLRPSAAIFFFFLSAFCWCSFAGTLTSRAVPALQSRELPRSTRRNRVGVACLFRI